MGRYIPVAEVAKLIRVELKKSFPGIKFSVRSDSYSGGASIRVRWTDGPLTSQVDEVVKPFSGARFDGMTDSTSYVEGELNGEQVSFGSDYVFTTRDYSGAHEERADAIARKALRDNGFDPAEVGPNTYTGPIATPYGVSPGVWGSDVFHYVARFLPGE